MIDLIYDALADPDTGILTRAIVTNDDVTAAIRSARGQHGVTLSDNNPANFMKDIVRGQGAGGMWPERLKALRIGGAQITGDGNVFEFVPYEEGQTEPFPTRFGYHESVQRHRIQSVSMTLGSKALGRNDETYLIQVAVKLRVVETHFSLMSPIDVIEIDHLQVGIKLRLCEVDSLYSATFRNEAGEDHRMVITCEAKKRGQRILEEQVIRQVQAAFRETHVDYVAPIAMTAADNGIYVAEFKMIERADLPHFIALNLETEALYELVPRVKGI